MTTVTTLVHLSDIHICAASVRTRLEKVVHDIHKRVGFKLDVEFANAARLDAIVEAVNGIDPDAVCVSGDITTFGDAASFAEALMFLKRLRPRGGNRDRTIVLSPGNHDVLCSQLQALLDTATERIERNNAGLTAWSARFFASRVPSVKQAIEALDAVRELLGDKKDVAPNPKAPLQHFYDLARELVAHEWSSVGAPGAPCVLMAPFQSVSLDPLWMNLGDATASEFNRYRTKIRQLNRKTDDVLVAMCHHNPLSSPDVSAPALVHAYNSFPAASAYVREMQDDGVDVILYGHQHRSACISIDYHPSAPGHVYLVGAASAVAHDSGFNAIRVGSRYEAELQPYVFRDSNRAVQYGSPISLVFEPESVMDPLTRVTQREVRHFCYSLSRNAGGEWDRQLAVGARDILMVGPRSSQLQTDTRLATLTELLRSPGLQRLRVLISDPSLFAVLDDLDAGKREKLSMMWGSDSGSWKDQAQIASQTLDELKRYRYGGTRDGVSRPGLSPELSSKLEIRLSHTQMPIGAILRYTEAGRDTDSVLVRLLPVGLSKAEMERALIRLERRHDDAAFQFYSQYLEKLWDRGTVAFATDGHGV